MRPPPPVKIVLRPAGVARELLSARARSTKRSAVLDSVFLNNFNLRKPDRVDTSAVLWGSRIFRPSGDRVDERKPWESERVAERHDRVAVFLQ